MKDDTTFNVILVIFVVVMIIGTVVLYTVPIDDPVRKLEKEIYLRELHKRLNDLPPVPSEAR